MQVNYTREMRTEAMSVLHSVPLPEITAFVLVPTEFVSLLSTSSGRGTVHVPWHLEQGLRLCISAASVEALRPSC